MRRLILDHALLPEGWAGNVGLDIEGGTILAVHPNASAEGRERVAGIALPGLPNLHSHTFQRGMAGLAETRGPEGDSFWTWRQVMYRFLGKLTPDDVEAIAAFAMMAASPRSLSSTICITTPMAGLTPISRSSRSASQKLRRKPAWA